MKIKKVLYENLAHYKKPSMVLFAPTCDFKCCREQGVDICICQNSDWAQSQTQEISNDDILKGYRDNMFSNAIVFAGLEPLKNIDDVIGVIKTFRENKCNDDVVVFTGYREDEDEFKEFKEKILALNLSNIIVKVGRFILNQKPHYDKLLGVNLASDNQYAIKIA